MIRKIRDKILQIDTCVGIEITLLPNDGLLIYAIKGKLVKNKIRKEKDYGALTSFDELVKKVGTAAPIAISVNGKGILQKKMDPATLPDNPVEAILSNANPHEFYYAVTEFDHFSSVAIIRREALDKIIADLTGRGFKLLSVSLGLADIQFILPFINFARKPELIASHFSLSMNDTGQLTHIEYFPADLSDQFERSEYNIGDQYVASPALLAFGTLTGLLATGIVAAPPFSHATILQQRTDHVYYKYYKAAIRSVLIGVFAILFINFLIYDHYFSKNKEWQDSQVITNEQEVKIKKLGQAIQMKEGFIMKSGWDGPSKLSFYADRIAGMVPSGTLLTGMKINPMNTAFIGDGSISFRKDTIQVTGICEDPTELNQFTNNLKNIRDFKEVAIRNYLYKKEIGSGSFLMEILIK